MRVDGMLCETVTPLFLLVLLAAHTNALPIQYLPDIPGYIPVYIRHGDQPLEDINPALVEAFHESTGILKNIQKTPLNDLPFTNSNKDLRDRNDVTVESDEENTAEKNAQPPVPSKQLIYILPDQETIFAQNIKPHENESVIMKLFNPSSPDKIDSKKITKEIKQKEGNK